VLGEESAGEDEDHTDALVKGLGLPLATQPSRAEDELPGDEGGESAEEQQGNKGGGDDEGSQIRRWWRW